MDILFIVVSVSTQFVGKHKRFIHKYINFYIEIDKGVTFHFSLWQAIDVNFILIDKTKAKPLLSLCMKCLK